MHNWGLDLSSSISCKLHIELVHNGLAMSSRSISFSSAMRDYKNEHHNIHDWPLLHMGNASAAELLESPLAIDFSYLHSPANSFSDEGNWDANTVNFDNVSK